MDMRKELESTFGLDKIIGLENRVAELTNNRVELENEVSTLEAVNAVQHKAFDLNDIKEEKTKSHISILQHEN